jgi:hypothetical protein
MISAATGAIALVVAPLAREHGLGYLVATVILGGLFQIALGSLGVAKLLQRLRDVLTRPGQLALDIVSGIGAALGLDHCRLVADEQESIAEITHAGPDALLLGQEHEVRQPPGRGGVADGVAAA